MYKMIAAVDNVGGIGKDGSMPWGNIKEDLQFFEQQTKNHICVMGRKTYEDILRMKKENQKENKKVKKLLKNRTSYVLSKDENFEPEGASQVFSVEQVQQKHPDQDIFILGGQGIFEQYLKYTSVVYCTVIDNNYNCDTFFPVENLDGMFKIEDGEQTETAEGLALYFMTYQNQFL